MLTLAALLAAGLAVASADESIEPTETVAPSIVILRPGENLVGWLGEALPVDRLMRRFPAIESVSAWEPLSGKFYEPASLVAGQGYVVTLSGDKSVQWRRPMTPVKGKVTLQRGRNLVTWLGPDGWTIDRVVLGIGRALIHAEYGSTTYESNPKQNQDSMPLVGRGDPLWIKVSRTVNWLQPTGLQPDLEFPGGVTSDMETEVRRDLREVIEFFSREFGVEADFSEVTVYVAKDVESYIQHAGLDDVSANGVRDIWYGAGAWAWGGVGTVNKQESWQRKDWWDDVYGEYSLGRSVLAHEYFHLIQHQLSGTTDTVSWMVEGNANWAQYVFLQHDQGLPRDTWISSPNFISELFDAPPLDHVERDVEAWHYRLGEVATRQLVSLSALDSPMEFWRTLLPVPLGPYGRWIPAPNWQDAFAHAFGQDVETFYAEFAEWRADAEESGATAHLLGPDGEPLSGFTVFATFTVRGDDRNWRHNTVTASGGRFRIPVREDGLSYVLGVDLGGCQLYQANEGVASYSGAHWFDVADGMPENVEIRLAADSCVWQIRGMLTDAQGNGISNQRIYAGTNNGGGTDTQTGGDGAFSITVPAAGLYRLQTSIEGCTIYYREGEPPGSRQEATEFDIQDADVTGLRFQLTEGLCSTRITGRLLHADGAGIAEVWVYARGENSSNANGRTESDGSFSIIVPNADVYRLNTSIEGCSVYFRRGGAVTSRDRATRITIDDRDVTGVRFQLREGQCSTKISGRLLDAAGQAIADTRVYAQPENGGSASALTDSEGTFAITVPGVGQYRVSAWVDGCRVHYRRSGITANWNQATQIRVSDSDVTGIRIQLTEGMCEHRISGRLFNADGTPRSGQWVSASGNAGNGGGSTAADGSFSFAVPSNGSYRLSTWIDGCNIYRGSRGPTTDWHSASQVRVSNADVTGIEFGLPEDPGSFCN